MTLAIKHSVGKSGVNDPPDVKIVQQLLNGYLASIKAQPLAVDGALTGKMVAAILDFQVKAMHFAQGNGQVKPASDTFKRLVLLFGDQVTPAPTAPLAKPNKTATAAGKAAAAIVPKG